MALLVAELRAHLLRPAGLAVLSVWLFLVGALFVVELSAYEQAQQRALQLKDPGLLALLDVNDLLLAAVNHQLLVVLLFLAPLVGGRAFVDGAARAWLLHATPSLPAFVGGKLGAAIATVTLWVLATLALPIVCALAGQSADPGVDSAVVDVGQAVVGAITVALAGAAFVSVGACASALSGSAVVAALASFLALTVLWLMPSAAPLAGPVWGPVLELLSPASHVERGLRGVVSGADVAYFVSVIIAAAAACVVAVDGERR
jgi:ABC-2 type transport system permease protein